MMKKDNVISPSQGLLLLMRYYKHDILKVNELKKLYLSGATDPDNAQRIQIYLSDPVLSSYEVKFDRKTIDDDPTRRYFETHLSYATLEHELDNPMVTKQDLQRHVKALTDALSSDKRQDVEHVLNGELRINDTVTNEEYAEFIAKLKSGQIFAGLPAEHVEKIELLVKSSFLGVIYTLENNTTLPINIYAKGLHNEKGNIEIANQKTTRNQNLGLLKSHMPLSRDDSALSDVPFSYLKPSDRSTFQPSSSWVKQSFDQWVHPFANGISGTILCQLRSMAQFAKNQQDNPTQTSVFTDSQEKMSAFCKLLACAMLFGLGGHSLYEFIAVLSLPDVKTGFSSIYTQDITMDSLFNSSESRAPLDQAIQKTMDYNDQILMKANLNTQIEGRSTSLSQESKQALLSLRKNQLSELINDLEIKASTFYVTQGHKTAIGEIKKFILNHDYRSALTRIDAIINPAIPPEESEDDRICREHAHVTDTKYFMPLTSKLEPICFIEDQIELRKAKFAHYKDQVTAISSTAQSPAETAEEPLKMSTDIKKLKK